MKIVCLTPVKNEEWIIGFFLIQTSIWADVIILADQQSTDYTTHIASKYGNVKVISNNDTEYDEGARQRLLLNHARKTGKHLLFALDADEMLSPGFDKTDDWDKILHSPPGTAFYFRLLNISPDLKHYWSPPLWFNFAYNDDGAPHQGSKLHSPRLPQSSNTKKVYLEQIKVLHFQFIDWQRMASKHRWYQCEELVNNPHLSTIKLYRQYHHMDIPTYKLIEAPSDLIPQTLTHALNTLVKKSANGGYYWDRLVAKLITKYGAKYFADLAIWDSGGLKSDPRTVKQKMIHHYLHYSQNFYGSRLIAMLDRIIEKI